MAKIDVGWWEILVKDILKALRIEFCLGHQLLIRFTQGDDEAVKCLQQGRQLTKVVGGERNIFTKSLRYLFSRGGIVIVETLCNELGPCFIIGNPCVLYDIAFNNGTAKTTGIKIWVDTELTEK